MAFYIGSNRVSPIIRKSAAVIEGITITPSTTTQTIIASGDTDGYSPIVINAIAPTSVSTFNHIVKTDGTVENVKKSSNSLSATATSTSFILNSAYRENAALLSMNLGSLVTISQTLSNLCEGCENLVNVDFTNLETMSGNFGLYMAFVDCPNLTTISFPKLSSITGRGPLYGLVASWGKREYGSGIETIYFNSLNSNSFGTNTDQFEDMLVGTTNCVVHFPSNLQSVIGSWSDVQNGFGGTDTSILFDLPATT